ESCRRRRAVRPIRFPLDAVDHLAREVGSGADFFVGPAAGEVLAHAQKQLPLVFNRPSIRQPQLFDGQAPLRAAGAGAQGVGEELELLVGFEIEGLRHQAPPAFSISMSLSLANAASASPPRSLASLRRPWNMRERRVTALVPVISSICA